MDCYKEFAHIYDKLINKDIDYEKWANTVLKICEEQNLDKNDYLDLGCGTGNLTEQIVSKFDNTWAVDLSYEMLTEDFSINITKSADYTDVSANLIYNSTSYIATQVGTGDTIQFVKTGLEIPIYNKDSISVPFYWEFLFTDDSGTTRANSTSSTQTVDQTIFARCNATYTEEIVNYTEKSGVSLFEFITDKLSQDYNVVGDYNSFARSKTKALQKEIGSKDSLCTSFLQDRWSELMDELKRYSIKPPE